MSFQNSQPKNQQDPNHPPPWTTWRFLSNHGLRLSRTSTWHCRSLKLLSLWKRADALNLTKHTKRNTFKTFPFWNSKHPLPTRSRFLRATVGSTSSALCLHHAHPFVSATEKIRKMPVSCHEEKQRVWSRSCGLQDLLQCSDCALSCSVWLLQTKEQLSRLSFSSSGLEVGLPAFQLPMFPKCDSLPKGDLLDMFV